MSINRCVIDVGNTSVTSALFADGEIVSPQRFATSQIVEVKDVEEIFDGVRLRTGKEFTEIVACVGVAGVRTLFEKYAETSSINICFVSGINPCGAKLQYETVETLGPDRIANTIAAASLHSQPTLVVDCGTAINIDLIDEEGTFVGGMIAPGPETSRDALTHFAPSLPEVPIVASDNLIGTSTVSCIQSGIINGSAAMIDSVVNQLLEVHQDLVVVVTGGFSEVVFPLLNVQAQRDEWLTLKGLGFAQTS